MLELGKAKKASCLEVKIGETVYYVPSFKNMPVTAAKRLRDMKGKQGEELGDAYTDFFFDYFAQYLGEGMDAIDMEDFQALCDAWGKMGEGEGVGLGE